MINGPMMAPIHLRHLSLAAPQPGQQKIQFTNPNTDNYPSNIEYTAKLHRDKGIPCYAPDMFKGKTVVVVGSGPSLKEKDNIRAVRKAQKQGAVIFACKQAIKFLVDNNIIPEVAVTMDPGAHIARPEKIYKAPGTLHLVASSSDPLLVDYFLADCSFENWLKGLTDEQQESILGNDYDGYKAGTYIPPDAGEDKANIMFFHSATGYSKEVKMYEELFSEGSCMGGGYNVVNRAVSAAMFMGANKIILAGTDCGWRPESKFYVDDTDNRPGVDMSDKGVVEGTDAAGNPLEEHNGQPWMTRPDMLASGVALAKLAKHNEGMFEFIGDILPAKLFEKDFEFLQKCASFAQQ